MGSVLKIEFPKIEEPITQDPIPGDGGDTDDDKA